MQEKESFRQKALKFVVSNSDTLLPFAKYALPTAAVGAIVSWSAWLIGVFGQDAPFSWIVASLLAAFVMALIIVLLAWAYRIRIRTKYDAKFLGSSGPISPMAKTFEDQRIYLNDFCLPSHPFIDNKTFIDCEIIGPANIMLAFGNSATENREPRLDAVVLNGKNQFTNGFVFRNCIFRQCSFQRITLFVTPIEYPMYKDNPILNWISATQIDEPSLPMNGMEEPVMIGTSHGEKGDNHAAV
jgi:hypothetical protein